MADLFATLIGFIIALGWAQVFLALIRKNISDWNDFKTEPMVWLRFIKTFLWYLGYIIAWGVICAIPFVVIAVIGLLIHIHVLASLGTILALIAFGCVAIYFGVRYQFIEFAVLDYPELTSRKIFKEAGRITNNKFLWLLGFDILMGLFNLVGFICLGVGLIITVPVSKIARTKVYDLLKVQHAHANSV